MIEKTDVVVGLFDRLDHVLDEFVETIEQILNVFWNVEIHGSPSLCTSRGSLASTPPTALNTFQSRRSSTSRDPTNRLPHAARVY
jgi:hypothetical protein